MAPMRQLLLHFLQFLHASTFLAKRAAFAVSAYIAPNGQRDLHHKRLTISVSPHIAAKKRKMTKECEKKWIFIPSNDDLSAR